MPAKKILKERSFRFSCNENEIELTEEMLCAEGLSCRHEKFYPLAARTCSSQHGSPSLGATLASHFGLIYIQDFSSMLPPLILKPEPGAMVLDMCASPGSKTGLLASLVGKNGMIIANEPNYARLANLRRNMMRENNFQVITSAYRGENIPLAEGSCPYILLDAPCSGWGTENKHPGIKKLWHGKKIAPLIGVQKLLLQKAARLLAPGGRLVYSTCTTNEWENEQQVYEIIDKLQLIPERIETITGFAFDYSPEGFVKVDGEKSGSQDFFVASLRKDGLLAEQLKTAGSGQKPVYNSMLNAFEIKKGWPCRDNILSNAFKIYAREEQLFLAPHKTEELPDCFDWQGTAFGRNGSALHIYPRMRAFLPDYIDDAGLFNVQDIEPLKALLSGRSLSKPVGLEQGWTGLYYKGLKLGFIRVKGDRILWTDR